MATKPPTRKDYVKRVGTNIYNTWDSQQWMNQEKQLAVTLQEREDYILTRSKNITKNGEKDFGNVPNHHWTSATPQPHHENGIFSYKPSIWGYTHLWKPPYVQEKVLT